MRIHLFIATTTLLGVGVACTSEEMPAPGARISFAELEHDFGEVMEGETAEHIFRFKNTGTTELEVISARGS